MRFLKNTSIGYDAVEQQQYPGRNVQWRDARPVQELFQKELTVTFQLVDGYINYWMMQDILKYYYAFENRQPYIENLNVRMMDSEGNALVTARMIRPLIKSMGDLSMSFASNVAEFSTFDVTFGYNELDIEIELA